MIEAHIEIEQGINRIVCGYPRSNRLMSRVAACPVSPIVFGDVAVVWLLDGRDLSD